MAEPEAYLDALLRALDSEEESPADANDHQEDVDVVDHPGEREGELPHAVIPPDPGPATVEQRSPVQRSPIIGKYISSSSARRRALKATNCNFCNQEHDRGSLSGHLEQSERCRILYFRKFHVKSVDAVMCQLYECLFCPDKAPKLFHHLESKELCRVQYLNKFDVASSREAVEKIAKLKRTGYKSRRSLSRAIENEKSKRRRFEELSNEPVETSLNAHLNKNLFSNFKTCIGCLCNVGAAEEVTNDSDCIKNGLHSIENKPYLKRMGKYWICKHCVSEIPYTVPTSKFVMQVQHDGDTLVFLPELEENIEGNEEENNDNLNDGLEIAEDSKRIFIMFPCSKESLNLINAPLNLKSLDSVQIQHVLYGTDKFDKENAAVIYEHQLHKFLKAKTSADQFVGRILDSQARTLTGVQSCSQESRIVGSTSWRRSKIQELSWKRTQLGEMCLKVSVLFPFDDPQTLATHLIQQGRQVSVTLTGGENGELEKTYYVHTGHDASSPCLEVEECLKVPLTEYLQQEDISVQPKMGTYISSVEKLINSFITDVLKSPSSKMMTEDFHFNISFDSLGQVIIEGLIWPICLQDLNLMQFNKDLSSEQIGEKKAEIVDILRKSISSSSNVRVIMSQYNMSETEAIQMSRLVETHQTHVCQNEDCSRCQAAPLPSLRCFFKQFPESPENIPTSKRFLKLMKAKLHSLSVEDIRNMATYEWLQSVWEEVDVSEPEENNYWRITLGDEDFYFKFDASLAKLLEMYDDEPFAALYQYCLGLGETDLSEEFVMKRLNLLDCYTDSYIPLLLRAANSPIKVTVLTWSSNSGGWSFENPNYNGCIEAGLHSHVKIPLSEAYSLIDNNKLKTRSSRTSEFVFTGSSPSVLLKRVPQATENCFRYEGDGAFYEMQETIVTRYCQRLNGRDLLLSEVACHYDFIGKESEAKYEVFHDRLDKIPSSDIEAVVGDQKLPELIILENKDVLEIRKKSKVLMFKSFENGSYDHKFSQVLLFSVVNKFEDLTQEVVEAIYEQVNEETQENILKANKRMLYKRLISGGESLATKK